MTSIRTRVLDILDAAGIAYRLLPHAEPVFTIEAAARQRGVTREEMVKSILLRDAAGRYVMACVNGDARVEPQKVRAELGGDWRRLSFASAEEILRVTGCPMGAVSPIGLPAGVPVLFDESIPRCRRVNISSGDPMLGLELDPGDLLRISGARVASIAQS
jgi:prolyl-tRNA editing enzyme YbaK/EbsC (Cys-tRNA(Pro) deacylase)